MARPSSFCITDVDQGTLIKSVGTFLRGTKAKTRGNRGPGLCVTECSIRQNETKLWIIFGRDKCVFFKKQEAFTDRLFGHIPTHCNINCKRRSKSIKCTIIMSTTSSCLRAKATSIPQVKKNKSTTS